MLSSRAPLLRMYWICWGITALSVFISAGYSGAALFSEGSNNVYTLYAASRSFSLALVVLSLARFRSPGALIALAAVMTLIQLGDAVIGFRIQDAAKSFGPLGLAILTLLALVSLLRSKRQSAS